MSATPVSSRAGAMSQATAVSLHLDSELFHAQLQVGQDCAVSCQCDRAVEQAFRVSLVAHVVAAAPKDAAVVGRVGKMTAWFWCGLGVL